MLIFTEILNSPKKKKKKRRERLNYISTLKHILKADFSFIFEKVTNGL